MHAIKRVEYLNGYRLRLHFFNGEVRIIDLENDLKKSQNLFLDLIDINYFKKVKRVGESIAWPNGIDYCPDWLYMNSQLESKSVARKKIKKPSSSTKKLRKRKKIIAKA